ncbi:hypothetical protein EZ313_19270 [Ramlibacter henchirensis]|uniref:Uncharacterized protein n=1 Tax=Ramlibacter henchirensis TaxID=204072 RepID=A0A4Z0BQT5_9BURK|nr:hypothetical protein [Ramlibacter henchirensis]TFZ00598.1 hypothetical protein EZ313_19270 [Ramlibacter henchirensis]
MRTFRVVALGAATIALLGCGGGGGGDPAGTSQPVSEPGTVASASAGPVAPVVPSNAPAGAGAVSPTRSPAVPIGSGGTGFVPDPTQPTIVIPATALMP